MFKWRRGKKQVKKMRLAGAAPRRKQTGDKNGYFIFCRA
jgi:hypothetical protein